VRIIAGTAKGRTLKSLKGLRTRPTLDRVREAVFNILGTKIIGAHVLDLFAGSGAIGIEALSRGAASCCFNDRNRAVSGIIKENITKCTLSQTVLVLTMDALECISYLKRKAIHKFDLIYLDPPYQTDNLDYYLMLVQSLLREELLAPEGLIIIETDKKLVLEKEFYAGEKEKQQSIRLWKNNQYGDTVIWFYKLQGEE